MKLKIFLRPALSIVFGFFGAFIARSGTPPDIFAITGDHFVFVAFIAFAVLGFILPDIVELAGKAGIAVLAKQISERIQSASSSRLSVPRISLRRRQKNIKYDNPMILDTSALIDGRLLDVVKTGFVFGTFLIIPSVVRELHQLADSADELKRAKGRRGLEVLSDLQAQKNIKVEVLANEPREKSVDDMLVRLSREIHAKVVTVDFNLNKVAKVKKVTVLNLNELANAVKTAVLPGQRLKIQINAIGKERNQGIGYLLDGTMVVVEEGARFKGREIEVSVLRVLQTAAGKMIFAKIANRGE